MSVADLLERGTELEECRYYQPRRLQPLMIKIRQLGSDFDSQLSSRKKRLTDSVKLHRLTEVVSVTAAAHSLALGQLVLLP